MLRCRGDLGLSVQRISENDTRHRAQLRRAACVTIDACPAPGGLAHRHHDPSVSAAEPAFSRMPRREFADTAAMSHGYASFDALFREMDHHVHRAILKDCLIRGGIA